MPWYKLLCPFEGPSADGIQIALFAEAESVEDACELIQRSREDIEPFTQHSIRENLTVKSDKTTSEIRNHVDGIFDPDVAVYKNGDVYSTAE